MAARLLYEDDVSVASCYQCGKCSAGCPAAEDMDVAPSQVLHTAQSLFHDHVPAKALGLSSAWIDRQGVSGGGSPGATVPVQQRPAVDFVFPTMRALADAALNRPAA